MNKSTRQVAEEVLKLLKENKLRIRGYEGETACVCIESFEGSEDCVCIDNRTQTIDEE